MNYANAKKGNVFLCDSKKEQQGEILTLEEFIFNENSQICKHAEVNFKQDEKEGKATIGKIKTTKTKKFMVIEMIKDFAFSNDSKFYSE